MKVKFDVPGGLVIMKVIYIAGPYRADTEHGVVENIRRAEEVAIKVWQAGHVALCPHKNTALFGGLCPDEAWLKGDLELLRRCDGIIMVQGWEKSSGSVAEVGFADRHNIPVYYEVEDIPT